jgi:hypothetical protein
MIREIKLLDGFPCDYIDVRVRMELEAWKYLAYCFALLKQDPHARFHKYEREFCYDFIREILIEAEKGDTLEGLKVVKK